MQEVIVQVDDVFKSAEIVFVEVDPAVSEEARVLNAAFDVLEQSGRVTMRALREVLRWNNKRYAALRAYFDKWNMGTWENGEVSE